MFRFPSVFDPHSFLKLNFSILGSRLLIPRSPILDFAIPAALLEPASLLTLFGVGDKKKIFNYRKWLPNRTTS